MNEDCIFCKIIKGEIPCSKVYEDDEILAFLDINPINKGHSLIIPKEHYDNLDELTEELAEQCVRVVKKVAPAVVEAMEADGYNFSLNNGEAAGQVVGHAHFHVIPRFKGDGFQHWPHNEYDSEEEAEKVARDIADTIYEQSREEDRRR